MNTEQFSPEFQAAAKELRQKYPYDTNINAIGMGLSDDGKDQLFMYLNKKPKMKYPSEFNGFPVKQVVTGEFRIGTKSHK